jgi:hypothetical protein
MKVPKYIKDLLKKGAKGADMANRADCIVHEWMKNKGIEPDDLSSDPYLYINHVSVFAEPYSHAQAIIKWIEEH